ncbi:MAG TPA: hypothetical protein ENJ90_09790 [Devosia sp.]|nr:hypothetical protein [Devosia sp.]
MIRVFVLAGIVGGLAIAYVSIFTLGPIAQLAPPETLLTGYRALGAVPQSVNLAEDESVEHDIFGVPEEDEVQLAIAMEALGDMGDMNMGGDGAAMDMGADDNAAMDMEGDGTAADMAADDNAAMDMEGDGTATAMDMTEEEAPHTEGEAAGGLLIANEENFDREINLKMTEWGFSDMNIAVTKGETIRFNVVNDGEILHEFMIMEMAAMQAVGYRVNRADWSLLEHEALYEKSLVLPEGTFSFTVEIQENGAWMFMCMLPYHMEMGMMGQMATEGMAMDMQT